ncbi:MAG TPA: dephospho-CoA kinase [Candidatus Eisenbacteria bacterium]|nr:dephospho-CoA kinase [Candidatus Eisenbacteria bacterium]
MSTERVRTRRAHTGDGLFILGLVGRAGSGKSTVARALVADGAALIDADQIGHQVTDQDAEVRHAMIAEYGDDIYRPDGALDRRRVAARVFRDPDARARLDALVHPRILARAWEALNALRLSGHRGVVVLDSALLLHWGMERSCDAVLAVRAPEEGRVERLMQSRGWSADEARAVLGVQRPDTWFTEGADLTIDNSGTVAELERASRAAVVRLRAERQAALRPA